MTDKRIQAVTDRIRHRSSAGRDHYLQMINEMRSSGPSSPHLSCGNLAHAIATFPSDEKKQFTSGNAPNIAIVSAYNDMLSAHQPYHKKLDEMKHYLIQEGALSQMAGGVPAMCDGVTQGQPGMELSLFSRDVIAMSTAIALSHNVFNGGLFFGICDKIVPGLLIGALSFGHLPFIFVPSGPMSTGISNEEKAKVREQYAQGIIARDALLESESKAYHSSGTCTFYGTANTNQMMLEMMGLQLPGSSFVNPHSPLRPALDKAAAKQILKLVSGKNKGLAEIFSVESLVNGVIGLLATGGSTNHTLHIVAIAAAAGFTITWQDFADLSEIIPLLARVYPNGSADVNAFHEAGGTPAIIAQLSKKELIHDEVETILGQGMETFSNFPALVENEIHWTPVRAAINPDVISTIQQPFQKTGGLVVFDGNIGQAVMKVSAVDSSQHVVEAPALVFNDQDQVIKAFDDGLLEKDFIAVLRFQGPTANGMPELHKLTPVLSVLQKKGFNVALVTDGRMSGASGKIPAAIHVCPEAAEGGAIALIENGDLIRLDATNGELQLKVDAAILEARTPAAVPVSQNTFGRNLFHGFRTLVGSASKGGSTF